jgi:hypothetical protein
MKPLVKRRTKEQVAADLPAKQEQVLEVELHPRHRKLYQTQLQRERQKVLGLIDDVCRNRFTILRSLTLVQRLASNCATRSGIRHRVLVMSAAPRSPDVRTHVVSMLTPPERAVLDMIDTPGVPLPTQQIDERVTRGIASDEASRRPQGIGATVSAQLIASMLIDHRPARRHGRWLRAGGIGTGVG